MALETSEQSPAPLHTISALLSGYIGALGSVWIEAEVVQPKQSGSMYYFTLRDLTEKASTSAIAFRGVFESSPTPITDGMRVVVEAKPDFYVPNGRLSLKVTQIKPAGQGALFAELETRKQLLAAEGLFEAHHKKPIPVLPRGIGLVTGRGSAAERDVIENITNRWAAAPLTVTHAVMQGPKSAGEVISVVQRFDADPTIDVIIVARGGGSLEDLLPFSDEGLVRAVFACQTPVISAIGHEPDVPILDFVADLRASTPTDAAKRVVPDEAAEREGIAQAIGRARSALQARVANEAHVIGQLRSRPVFTQPTTIIDIRQQDVDAIIGRSRTAFGHRLQRATDEVSHQLARIRSLSPLATLERGYAIVQGPNGSHVTDPNALDTGDDISVRVAAGRIGATVTTLSPTTEEETA
ncbi:MAG: exodeoxyribonuclease VII large subunit [Actinomycetales bacterium]|nr:exodeoxyribonuclease VII large subunit [Actinomycetales bacterium]